jgi:hypothetical protein
VVALYGSEMKVQTKLKVAEATAERLRQEDRKDNWVFTR